MDQMTQQNAAMVEETTAAAQTLAAESQQLRGLRRISS
jgi:methyl-accepting chemotaxis protein